jgi:hypothetical protein
VTGNISDFALGVQILDPLIGLHPLGIEVHGADLAIASAGI